MLRGIQGGGVEKVKKCDYRRENNVRAVVEEEDEKEKNIYSENCFCCSLLYKIICQSFINLTVDVVYFAVFIFTGFL